MDYKDFTKSAQTSLQRGTEIARILRHTHIENAHLLKGIIETDTSVTPFIFRRLGIKTAEFENGLAEIYKDFALLKENEELKVSKNVDISLNKAKQISQSLKDEYISIEHILSGILLTGDISAKLLMNKGINQAAIESTIKELRKAPIEKKDTLEKYEYLNMFAVNMNEKYKTGNADPIIGRIDEIRRVLQIVSRKTKNNPIIIGEPGVGKTSVVEGLAQRIVKGDVPENLKNCVIFALDLGSVIAGASKQGELESRFKEIIKEVKDSGGEVILFIDEIHLLTGAGRSGGKPGAADILKPALARGELKAIGATTINEYKKYIETDKALDRRFQKIIVDEPSIEESISILRGIKEKYQSFHRVRILDEAVIAAVELSHRYVTDRFLPDKAIDLMDEASSRLRLEINTLPTEIDELERKITILKTEKAQLKKEGNEETVKDLNDKISEISDKSTNYRAIWESEKTIMNEISAKRRLIQELKQQAEKAKEEGDFDTAAKITYSDIVEEQKALENLNAELDKNRSEVILSKESVDKELIAELISEITGIPVSKMTKSESEKLINLEDELGKRVIGQKEAIRAVSEAIRRSRAGLQDTGKPIGSFIFLGTTGVGKTELAKALAEFLFDDEKNIVRVDMSEYQEKHSVARLIGSPPGYVGYEEGGQLTEAVRMKPYSVVLLDEIEKAHADIFNTFLQVLDDGRLTDSQGRTVNFKNTLIIMTSNAGSDKINQSFEKMNASNFKEILLKTKEEVSKVLKETMRPEFLNRIDEIIMFMPLSLNSIQQIVELQLNKLKKNLKKENIRINFTSKAVNVLARLSYNPQFGARPVKRTIQKHILNELSETMLKNEVEKDKIINVDLEGSKLSFSNITDEELEKLKASESLITDEKSEDKTEKSLVKSEDEAKPGFWKRIGNWFRNMFGKKNSIKEEKKANENLKENKENE